MKALVGDLLQTNPAERPTMQDIINKALLQLAKPSHRVLDLLIVTCSPRGADQLAVDQEAKAVQKARFAANNSSSRRYAQPSARMHQVMPVSRHERAVSPAEFSDLLRTIPTKCLLFGGHGGLQIGYQHTLAFTSSTGGLAVVQPTVLCNILGSIAKLPSMPLELVFLNGCEPPNAISHIAEPLLHHLALSGASPTLRSPGTVRCDTYELGLAVLNAGMPNVVCWNGPVADEVAKTFSEKFFQSVQKGMDYQAAFEFAKGDVLAAIMVDGRLSNGTRAQVPKFEFRAPRLENGRDVSDSTKDYQIVRKNGQYGPPLAGGVPVLLDCPGV